MHDGRKPVVIRMVIFSLLAEICLMVFVISSSVRESSAEVASSKINNRGCRNKARAIEIRCFSPPDNFMPFSPSIVLMPLEEWVSNWFVDALFSASKTSSSLASGFTKEATLFFTCYKIFKINTIGVK
jgi:hypothetical protein